MKVSRAAGLARGLAVVLGRFLGARRHYLLSTSRSRFPCASQIFFLLDAIRMVEVVPVQSLDYPRRRQEPKAHDAEALLDAPRIM